MEIVFLEEPLLQRSPCYTGYILCDGGVLIIYLFFMAIPSNLSSASSPSPIPTTSTTPKTNSNLGGAIVFFVLIITALGFAWMFYPEYQQGKILKTGIEATATIVNIRPTGNTYNDQPQVELTMEVASSTGESFKTTSIMIINPVYLPQFQPGKVLKIKYDRVDRTKAAVEE